MKFTRQRGEISFFEDVKPIDVADTAWLTTDYKIDVTDTINIVYASTTI